MSWFSENTVSVISVIFGTGGIGYAIISRLLDRKKYEQEVRDASASADIKSDEFWKNRYEILNKEIAAKDDWWKERYDALYEENKNERKLSNEIITIFRSELSEMRVDYEKQREIERERYSQLLKQYEQFEEESMKKEKEYKVRINQLEDLVSKYESKINANEI